MFSLLVWCVCKERAVHNGADKGGEKEQVLLRAVGKDSKGERCRNVVTIIDCHFTSSGHLLQRLGVSLGALFFLSYKKKEN